MTIRDIKHAHEVSRALAQFFEDVRDDDPVSIEDGGLTSDEMCKATTFSRALHASLDDALRRVTREAGFGLLEVLVSMALSMVIIGALATVMLANARLAATLSKSSHEEAMARSRIAHVIAQPDITTPLEGVTVTLDPSTPEDAPCRLFHVETTTPSGKSFDAYASRGCVNTP